MKTKNPIPPEPINAAPEPTTPTPETITPNPHPWDRLPEESGFAFAAFLIFLHLPAKTRSLAAAYFSWKSTGKATQSRLQRGVPRDLPQAPGSWKHWASTHNWQKRARAFDRDESDRFVHGAKQHVIENGLFFLNERRHNYLDHHGILQKARENVLAALREGDLCERREKVTTYTREGGWKTVETRSLMRDQVRLVEKLGPIIFPPSRAIPTDEDGNPLFVNRDAMAEPGVPPITPERPYDKKKTWENLHVPPHFMDNGDDPGPGGTHAFHPITVEVPRHRYPYRPSHGPKSHESAVPPADTAKLKLRSQISETSLPGSLPSSPTPAPSPSPEPQGIREESNRVHPPQRPPLHHLRTPRSAGRLFPHLCQCGSGRRSRRQNRSRAHVRAHGLQGNPYHRLQKLAGGEKSAR